MVATSCQGSNYLSSGQSEHPQDASDGQEISGKPSVRRRGVRADADRVKNHAGVVLQMDWERSWQLAPQSAMLPCGSAEYHARYLKYWQLAHKSTQKMKALFVVLTDGRVKYARPAYFPYVRARDVTVGITEPRPCNNINAPRGQD